MQNKKYNYSYISLQIIDRNDNKSYHANPHSWSINCNLIEVFKSECGFSHKRLQMINSVIIQGNLGKPPERHGKIVTFSIANKYSVKKNGVYSDETSWIKIVVLYPKQADACEKFLDKGSQVVVDGELRIREHDGKYYTEIIANKIEFVSVKKQEQELF